MKKLIYRFRNWFVRRRLARIKKDMMFFIWAFSDAKALVLMYRHYAQEAGISRQKRDRARSKAKRREWSYDLNVLTSRMSELQSRAPNVDLTSDHAVLEITLSSLETFYKDHKHCIIGQYK